MKPSASIKRLAMEMASRRKEDRSPFLLVLGRAPSLTATAPHIDEVARRVFEDLLARGDELATSRVSHQDLQDKDKLIRAFYDLLGNVSRGKRFRMLHGVYKDIPVPLCYQHLAVLIKAGYFNTILTTNLHTLLEQALSEVALLLHRDYQVIDLGAMPGSETRSRPPSTRGCPINIVKLFDYMETDQINTPPEKLITHILEPQDSPAEKYVLGDAVVVGYEFESEAINEWFVRAPSDKSTRLWWVTPERPDAQRIHSIERVRDVARVDEPDDDPEIFFGQLRTIVLRLPKEMLPTSVTNHPESPTMTVAREPGSASTGILPDDHKLEELYADTQLRASQAVLYDLEVRESSSGKIEKTNYQRRKIIEIEDEKRDGDRVRYLTNQIIESAARSDTNPGTLCYMRSEEEKIENEYAGDHPNQDVVSGAITGLLVVAMRQGTEKVRSELVHSLAEFAPSNVVKRNVIP